MLRLSAVVLALTCAGLAHAESLRIEPKHAKFDSATAYSTVKQSYTVHNDGDRVVAIRDWKSIGGLGEVKGLPKSLAPGESKAFEVDLPLPGSTGSSLHRFALFTDEADVERYRFTLSGFVYSVITPAGAQIDFGKIAATSKAQREVTLEAREAVPLQLTSVVSAPNWLEASVSGSTVSARLRPNSPLGMQAGSIKLATNVPRQPFVEVLVKAVVEGNLKPSTYVLGMKPQQVGSTAETSVELAYDGKAKLKDLRTEALPGWGVTRSKCGQPPVTSTQCVKVTFRKQLDETGRHAGFVRFTLDGEPTLSIPFGSMVLGKDQTVRELVLKENSELANPGYANFAQALSDAASGRSAGAQAASASPQPATGDGPKIAHSEGKAPVTLNWRSANDGKLYGYMVYRAEDRAGPFHRVSDTPILKSETVAAAAIADYTFTDKSVETGKTYYYYIDTVAIDGSQQRFSPVLSKKVLP